MRHGDLDTVRVPPRPAPPPPRRHWRWIAGAGLCVLVAGAAALSWRQLPGPLAPASVGGSAPAAVATGVSPPATVPDSAPVLPAASVQREPPARPRPTEPLATEAEILATVPVGTAAARFVLQPEIVVLEFATLADQAQTLNRIAAFVERAGFPHDRVVSQPDLDTRLRAAGDTPETLYYGHDYRAADVVRFFDAASGAGQPLTPGEQSLSGLVAGWGWRSGRPGALISLVGNNGQDRLDQPARSTVLRHELSHGLYFVDAAYAAYARSFWSDTLTPAERRQFTTFLGSDGYDTHVEDLMINETQAYLIHTADTRFFNAAAVGLTPERLALLRGLFLTGMPPSWLRDCTTLPVRSR